MSVIAMLRQQWTNPGFQRLSAGGSNLVLLRFSFRNLRQPAFPVNRLSIFSYVEVIRQDGLVTDGALER
jgi:hypothetical protein